MNESVYEISGNTMWQGTEIMCTPLLHRTWSIVHTPHHVAAVFLDPVYVSVNVSFVSNTLTVTRKVALLEWHTENSAKIINIGPQGMDELQLYWKSVGRIVKYLLFYQHISVLVLLEITFLFCCHIKYICLYWWQWFIQLMAWSDKTHELLVMLQGLSFI